MFARDFSHPRIEAVASRPSISGISTSISTKSNVCDSTAFTASLPLLAIVTECPCFWSRPSASFWFTRLSSATKIRDRVSAGSASAGLRPGSHRRHVRPSRDRVEQFRLLDRFHRCAATPLASPFSTSSGRAPEVSRITTVIASALPLTNPICQGESIFLGHVHIGEDQAEWILLCPCPIERLHSFLRTGHATGVIFQLRTISSRISRFVALSSTINTRTPSDPQTGDATRGIGGSQVAGKRAVK